MCNNTLSKKWQLGNLKKLDKYQTYTNTLSLLISSCFCFQEAETAWAEQCITMSQQDNSNSKKKNPLNNSSIDLRTDKVLPLPTVKVLHVHNMLNADKENIQYAPMEKNLARSLRPALRTVNQTVSTISKKCPNNKIWDIGIQSTNKWYFFSLFLREEALRTN